MVDGGCCCSRSAGTRSSIAVLLNQCLASVSVGKALYFAPGKRSVCLFAASLLSVSKADTCFVISHIPRGINSRNSTFDYGVVRHYYCAVSACRYPPLSSSSSYYHAPADDGRTTCGGY